jgi:hypothetical protein
LNNSAVPPSPARKSALLFRTHYWNDFVEAQFNRLCAMSGDAVDVFIAYNETSGTAPKLPAAAAERLVSHTLPSFAMVGLDIKVACGMWHLFDCLFYDVLVKWPRHAPLAMIENEVH